MNRRHPLRIALLAGLVAFAMPTFLRASAREGKKKDGPYVPPAGAAGADHGSRPNFVIVMGDDISWTSFGCANPGGYTRTPNIDQLAKQGLRFTNFHCAGAQCVPCRHELYTALLPPSSGVYANGKEKGTVAAQ